jgi:4'-phosphopantetheinyl transferase
MSAATPIYTFCALEPGAIHLWLFHDRGVESRSSVDCRELLNDEERAQEVRFCFSRDRRQFLFSRALLRRTLSRYAPVKPRDWIFSANSYGRPEIVNTEGTRLELSFNLSHTRGLIVLAVTRRRVLGVDVENITCRTPSLELANRFFAIDEAASLKAVPSQLQPYRFFEYWTFKEAYIKARGMGMSLPLDKFSFHFPDPNAVVMIIQPELQDSADRWQFWQFRPTPDHLIAVCAEVVEASCPVLCRSESGATVTSAVLRTSKQAQR